MKGKCLSGLWPFGHGVGLDIRRHAQLAQRPDDGDRLGIERIGLVGRERCRIGELAIDHEIDRVADRRERTVRAALAELTAELRRAAERTRRF